MNLEQYIQHIQLHLVKTHAALLDWFNKPEALKQYRPKDQGWTIAEILEHIALTSHFLLLLINKAADKAPRNNLSLEEVNYLTVIFYINDYLRNLIHA